MATEMPVFTRTNLGTRIVVPISPEATATEFKKEVEKAHSNCFPELGKIRVHAITVKRKSCFYHLSELMPLKHAFQGSRGTWFLHIETCQWGIHDRPVLSECVATELMERVSNGNDVTGLVQSENFHCSTKKCSTKGKKQIRSKGVLCLRTALFRVSRAANISKRKKKKRKRLSGHQLINCPRLDYELEQHIANRKLDLFASKDEDKQSKELFSLPVVESPCETFVESVSVSGLIKKYFSYNDEVTSSCSLQTVQKHKKQFKARMNSDSLNMHFASPSPPLGNLPKRMSNLPLPDKPSAESLRNQQKKPEVGKRLLVAASNLSLSVHKQNSTVAICKYRDGISMMPGSTSFVRNLAFEINDEDELNPVC